MKINQIYTILKDITAEALGEKAVLQEDLNNIVDIGTELENLGSEYFYGTYTQNLIDRIGRLVFVDRQYRGIAPSVLMDSWEYGSILLKINMELPEVTENMSWSLENNQSYDPNIFTQPIINSKMYNSKTTFEIPMSFTEIQIKQSFTSVEEMERFVSMIYNAIDRKMTLATSELILRCINNFIGETINDGNSVRAVNLLSLYNTAYNTTLTKNEALTNKDFLRFATGVILGYTDKIKVMSTLFNIGGQARFTPSEDLHLICLSEFARNCDTYLQSDTYHNELISLPKYEVIPYWQGSGTDYKFTSTSKIVVKTSGTNNIVTQDGILAVMFDTQALGVTNYNRRTTSQYNPRAEFVNEWHKQDAGYFNDFNENFVVFYIGN